MSTFNRLYFGLGGGLSTGYVGKWSGDLNSEKPQSPGFALGTFEVLNFEAGWFLRRQMMISLAFKLGYATSDMSENPVFGWQALGRFRYVIFGAESKSFFKLFLGAQLGVGDVYHVLELSGKKDTFKSGTGLIIGALLGLWLGTERIAFFLEIAPSGVIDFTKDMSNVSGGSYEHSQQHTFSLNFTAGLAIRLVRM